MNEPDQATGKCADAGFPPVAQAVDAALRLRDASLVIYRDRTLVEFKTEQLGQRLSRWAEDGHSTWQIGEFSGHHCHLAIEAVERVVFSAGRVSCQGGRHNYTVWFETATPAGNPFRPLGYFSVTLNRPYRDDGSVRQDIVGAVFDLYDALQALPFVSADEVFLQQMRQLRSRSDEPQHDV